MTFTNDKKKKKNPNQAILAKAEEIFWSEYRANAWESQLENSSPPPKKKKTRMALSGENLKILACCSLYLN